MITHAPVLVRPDPERQFELKTDVLRLQQALIVRLVLRVNWWQVL